MFSRARILGHPIHPMLIPLPITSFILALVALAAFAANGDAFFLRASYYLAIFGVLAGLVAGIPGLVDWFTIPGDVAAKPVATLHLALNATIVVLFFVSWLLLGGFSGVASPPIALPLALQVVGVALLAVSGWLGWEMVYRHHVAIEPVATEERRIVKSFERRRAA